MGWAARVREGRPYQKTTRGRTRQFLRQREAVWKQVRDFLGGEVARGAEMNACSSACGFCGKCDDGADALHYDCDNCGQTVLVTTDDDPPEDGPAYCPQCAEQREQAMRDEAADARRNEKTAR